MMMRDIATDVELNIMDIIDNFEFSLIMMDIK